MPSTVTVASAIVEMAEPGIAWMGCRDTALACASVRDDARAL
jgi:hypothetical protein